MKPNKVTRAVQNKLVQAVTAKSKAQETPELPPEERGPVPTHVAIILDGNGRWATRQNLPRSAGHAVGCETFRRVATYCKDIGMQYLTVYAFSTENWKRAEEEVKTLMNLFRRYLKRCIKSAHKNQMRVRIIGDPTRLAPDIREGIRTLEKESENYDRMFFQIALNYGGRDELLRGVQKLCEDVAGGKLPPDKLTEEQFSSYLDTADIPDPDLLIRTSGEQRISNFLLWQLAYSEFYFTDAPWPDFDMEELLKAIEVYTSRDRRYGKVKL